LLCEVLIVVDAAPKHNVISHFLSVELTHRLEHFTDFFPAKVYLIAPVIFFVLFSEVKLYFLLVYIRLTADLIENELDCRLLRVLAFYFKYLLRPFKQYKSYLQVSLSNLTANYRKFELFTLDSIGTDHYFGAVFIIVEL
jgi:hypothetical protein